MEAQGAKVVGFDLGWDLAPDLIPIPGLDLDLTRRDQVAFLCRVQNAWWYLWHEYELKAQTVYGPNLRHSSRHWSVRPGRIGIDTPSSKRSILGSITGRSPHGRGDCYYRNLRLKRASGDGSLDSTLELESDDKPQCLVDVFPGFVHRHAFRVGVSLHDGYLPPTALSSRQRTQPPATFQFLSSPW